MYILDRRTLTQEEHEEDVLGAVRVIPGVVLAYVEGHKMKRVLHVIYRDDQIRPSDGLPLGMRHVLALEVFDDCKN